MEPPWQRRLAVRVTRDAERHIRAGHPWVFDRSIESAKPGEPGDLAVVFDRTRDFLAIGLYDPTSPLAIRILHAGEPTTIDDQWLARAIEASIGRRRSLVDRGDTTALRLVHGENDGLGGLVIDRYESNLVLKLYTVAWIPWLDHLVEAALASVGPDEVDRVVLRLSRQVGSAVEAFGSDEAVFDGAVVHGPRLDGAVTFSENGLLFRADLVRGHKTGHFLDQRDNRQLIRSLAADRTVLDVFACTGGFSVHAAAGGARSVTSVDVSRPALEASCANIALNPAAAGSHHHVRVGDAFAVMEELAGNGSRFDLVVIDPPAFAQRRSQVERALSAYERLAALGAELTVPGGLLFQASCSGRVTADDLAAVVSSGLRRSGRRWIERERTGQPVDHPVGFAQGGYLKALLMESD